MATPHIKCIQNKCYKYRYRRQCRRTIAYIDFRFGHALNFNKSKDCRG